MSKLGSLGLWVKFAFDDGVSAGFNGLGNCSLFSFVFLLEGFLGSSLELGNALGRLRGLGGLLVVDFGHSLVGGLDHFFLLLGGRLVDSFIDLSLVLKVLHFLCN